MMFKLFLNHVRDGHSALHSLTSFAVASIPVRKIVCATAKADTKFK